MTVELKPELEAMIQERVRSGAFSSAEEVIERALEYLNAEEDWLTENRARIAADIEEGWAEAQAGELISGEEISAEMQQFKEEWKKQHRPF
jgi:putative addiction module CopG family antidote